MSVDLTSTADAPEVPAHPALAVRLDQHEHHDDGTGQRRPVLVWRFAAPVRMISSAVLGGGLTRGQWVINAEVALNYRRDDPAIHLGEIAAGLGLPAGAGAGLMTAANTRQMTSASDGAVRCDATVGLSYPTWAAASEGLSLPAARWRPGTVNLVCLLPVRLSDAAMVNAVITATEAKSQALLEAGMPGTGTASDAIVVCCPDGPGATDSPQVTRASRAQAEYCGPRSEWGARLARAVHAAVADGTARYAAAASTPG
ncbi:MULTISPECIES: adenosylcobinamide amidohydrolase [Parafrankia]|uniref:adenosylcobinamide amidohydrolase n=1 Tax=Parafrankia TaxID=2994362 RepID=UPI000B85E32C|nr:MULTISPECIES: adenosylcobinamide amidohydrolase [Parafrankia]MBE3204014.1 adenosylcobinamide amidohydrolase [Parafrankia sp. CH37]